MGQVPGQYLHYTAGSFSDYVPQGWFNWNRFINRLLTHPESIQLIETATAPIEFPDVSYYQGMIDWDVMSSQTKNIIIRAGQQTWPDSMFVTNWAAAKVRGMSRGCYWFYDDRASPQEQFNALWELIEHDIPEDRIWVDWELVYGGPYQGLKNVVSLMKLIEQRYYGGVGMYTGYYFFVDHSNPVNNKAEYEYLKEHAGWVAAYTNDGSSNNILIPPPWTSSTVELHQWGTPSYGQKYGVQSIEIDMNRVLNDPAGIYSKGEIMPPVSITKAWYEVINIAANTVLNVRKTPGDTTQASDIGDLHLADIVLADSTQNVNGVTWYHFIDARKGGNPEGQSVMCSDHNPAIRLQAHTDCWASGNYLRVTTIPVTPVPPTTGQSVLQIVQDGQVLFEFVGTQTFPPTSEL